jgi:hypothetical protein
MATAEGITRMYDQLGPAERATLTLEAKARGDHADADRLMASCPKVVYRAGDDRYYDRVELSFDKMAGASIVLQNLAGKLEVLHAVIDALEQLVGPLRINAALAFMEGLSFDGGDLPEEMDLKVADHVQRIQTRADAATTFIRRELEQAAGTVAQDLLDTWEAFSRFCGQRLGVTPQTLYAAWGFPPDMAQGLTDLLGKYGHLRPQEERTAEMFASLSKAWIERFGEEKGANDV